MNKKQLLNNKIQLFLNKCENFISTIESNQKLIDICFVIAISEQQSNELLESTMTVETQQNHDRLLGKNGVSNNVCTASNSNGVKKSSIGQQQQQANDQYKRFADNAMQVCNVNLMENTLASR